MSYWNKNWSNYNNQKRLHYNKYNRFIVLVDNSFKIPNISFTPVDFLKVNKSIQLII